MTHEDLNMVYNVKKYAVNVGAAVNRIDGTGPYHELQASGLRRILEVYFNMVMEIIAGMKLRCFHLGPQAVPCALIFMNL